MEKRWPLEVTVVSPVAGLKVASTSWSVPPCTTQTRMACVAGAGGGGGGGGIGAGGGGSTMGSGAGAPKANFRPSEARGVKENLSAPPLLSSNTWAGES